MEFEFFEIYFAAAFLKFICSGEVMWFNLVAQNLPNILFPCIKKNLS